MTDENTLRNNEYQKRYRKNNRESIKAGKLKYNQENSEKIREYQREYRLKNKEKRKRYSKEHHAKNPDARRSIVYKKTYGITLENYNEMLAKQNNVCAVCKQPEVILHNITKKPKRLAIDHDHKTGQVRGLLCHRCNVFLGNYEELRDLIPQFEIYLQAIEKELL